MERTWASATSYKNESLKVKIAKKKQITMSGLKLISGNSYQGLRKSNKKEIKNESKFFFPSSWSMCNKKNKTINQL